MVWPHLKILGHGEDNSAVDFGRQSTNVWDKPCRLKGARRRGRQKKRWEDNIKEWTGMGFGDSLRAAEDREGRKGIVAMSSVVPRWPPRLRDWDDVRWDATQSLPKKCKVFIFVQYIYFERLSLCSVLLRFTFIATSWHYRWLVQTNANFVTVKWTFVAFPPPSPGRPHPDFVSKETLEYYKRMNRRK